MSIPPDPRPQWGAPPPGSAPPGEPPTPERVRERTWLFVVMLIGLVIVVQLPLPFRLAGLGLALALLVVGVRVLVGMRRLQRANRPVRGRLPVTVGLGLTAVMLLTLMADAIYYPFSAGLERCLAEANTLTARDACQEEQQRRIDDLNERLRERLR